MRSVFVYTTSYCPYCQSAKALLNKLSIPFQEIDASDPSTRQMLVEKTGRRTVPQIFFGEESIGGFDDLNALHHTGKLFESLEGND